MYHMKGRIRYSELNENGELTIDGLVNYLQDCCSFQSEDMGLGLDFLQAHKCAWVIFGWHIDILRMPKYKEEIDVQTWPYQFVGFYGYRNFQICDREGNCLVRANSLWVLISTESGRPMKVPEEISSKYQLEKGMEMSPPPRKLRISVGVAAEEKAPIKVQHYHLDTNHHVNNGQYVLMAMEYMVPGKSIQTIKVEYKKSAVLGDVVYPRIASMEDCLQVELCDEKSAPYAVVELMFR